MITQDLSKAVCSQPELGAIETPVSLFTLTIPPKELGLVFSMPIPARCKGWPDPTTSGHPKGVRNPTDLPVSLSDGAEERDDPAAVGLRHGGALLQEQPAHLQLPAPRRRRQGCTGEKTSQGQSHVLTGVFSYLETGLSAG